MTDGTRTRHDPLKLVLIGAGWVSGYHLAALDRLGRTRLMGVASGQVAGAGATAGPRGAEAYPGDDVERMLDEKRPDIAVVAVPPWAAVGVLERLVERRIPFLAEKPLAATASTGPAALASAIAERGLVTAVGYHLRGLEPMTEVRRLLASSPAHLVAARWLGDTPRPAWWRDVTTGGGQVVEQATHLYDLARYLVGEAAVVAAAATSARPAAPDGVELVDGTAALLRFDTGAIGSFANSRRLASATIEFELASADLLVTLRKLPEKHTAWEVTADDGRSRRLLPAMRDPYDAQAEAFLNAVMTGNPGLALSTYADALRTDRLTRAVVAATGRGG